MTSDPTMTITGARQRQERFTVLQKWVSRALAGNLSCLIVPGPEVALSHGLDVTAAGMRITATPRDASVLLIIGELSEKMNEAVAVLYAQMPRPRAIVNLGGQTPSTLPDPDFSAGVSQAGLIDAVDWLKRALAKGAFSDSPEDFDAPVLHARIEYVCPMHPEVVQNEPGSCPKCGMDLVAREAGEPAPEHDHGHDHREHRHHEHEHQHHEHEHQHHDHAQQHEHHEHEHHHGHCHDHHDSHEHDHEQHEGHQHSHENHHDHGHKHQHDESDGDAEEKGSGHDHSGHHHSGHGHDSHEHGGHDHVGHGHSGHDHGGHDHGGHDHGGHDHGASGFMSMIEVTKDLPRSADGLAMDWMEVPFGPVFPGLPGGLKLTLTLDGDGVTEGQATSLVGMINESEEGKEIDAETFIERLASAMPLASVSYRLLACLAIERAAGLENDSATDQARAVALECERIASHLGWLAQTGRQLGFAWLTDRAATLQLEIRRASGKRLVELTPALQALAARLGRTPLLKSRLKGIGVLPSGTGGLSGPVARAADDAGDAWARLWQRLDEIITSLDYIKATGEPGLPVLRNIGRGSGTGEATVETPRGEAQLSLILEHGQVKSYRLDTACSHHIGLVAKLVEGRELGDALVAVGSLDLSPWEVIS